MKMLMKLLGVLTVLMLLASACGGEADEADSGDDVSTDADADSGSDDSGDADADADDDSGDADADADSGSDDDGDAPAASGDNFGQGSGELWDDQRDPLFTEFQMEFDRTHPFQGLDAFCFPTSTDEELADGDHPGITADAITMVHLRSRLEQLADIGFAIPIGDPVDVFDRFVDYVNTECGGIYGRQINMELVEVDAFNPSADLDALRNTACIQAVEDNNSVITINSTGFQGSANLCLTEGDSIFISTQGQPAEFVEAAEGKLVSLNHTNEDQLRFLTAPLLESGALDGKTVAVVGPDTPGQDVPTLALADDLEAAGVNVAVREIIGCNGTSSCSDGNIDAVAAMVDAGVDVVFPTLNVVSLPPFINEMITQGYSAGDVQFYNSGFNSQNGDLVSSKIVAFGGPAAGEFYNGALIVDPSYTGDFREEGYSPTPFQDMCHATFQAAGGPAYDAFSTETSEYGMVTSICVMLRIAFRAIFDAGPNPSFEDINQAVQNLGPVDNNPGIPSSLVPGKPTIPDAVSTLQFSFPCDDELPGFDPDNAGSCIQPVGDPWVEVS